MAGFKVGSGLDVKCAFMSEAEFCDKYLGDQLWIFASCYYLSGTGVIAQPCINQTSAYGSNWKQISTGQYGALAIKNDGTLWGWGSNQCGELGIPTSVGTYLSSPTQVGTSTTWKCVLTAGHTGVVNSIRGNSLGIKCDGTLWAWGTDNGGLGNTNASSSPNQIGTDTNWKIINTSGLTSFAIKTDGTLWVWGNNNNKIYGSNCADQSSPVQVGSDTNWCQISIGWASVAAIKTDGTLWGWGACSSALGIPTQTTDISSPTQIGTETTWKKVSIFDSWLGGNTNYYGGGLAIKCDGTLWGWGCNLTGRLGDGTNIAKSSPIQIGTSTNWKDITAGAVMTSFGLKTDGTIWSWGSPQAACGPTLGDGTGVQRSSPVQLQTTSDWKKLADIAAGCEIVQSMAFIKTK